VRGVYTEGVGTQQIGNYFESNTTNWEWVRGSGNSNILNASIGDILVSGGTPSYPRNNVDGCYQITPLNFFFDNAYVETGLGFRERFRSFNLGEFTTPSFSAGNFTANGSMTWTVGSGDVTTYAYTVVGNMMTLKWFIVSTTIGGTLNTELRIAIPGGFTAAKRCRVPCIVLNNATTTIGVADAQVSVGYIRIFVTPDATTNYVAGTDNNDTYGEMVFEVQ
jgi:hypothetical protein